MDACGGDCQDRCSKECAAATAFSFFVSYAYHDVTMMKKN